MQKTHTIIHVLLHVLSFTYVYEGIKSDYGKYLWKLICRENIESKKDNFFFYGTSISFDDQLTVLFLRRLNPNRNWIVYLYNIVTELWSGEVFHRTPISVAARVQ